MLDDKRLQESFRGTRYLTEADPPETVRMNSSMRATINRDLDRTFKNQYFERMGTAVKLILQVLNSHGFEEANVFTQQDVNKEKGHLTYQIAQKTDDPFSPVTVTNTMLVLQYGKAGDRGRYEVVTYLS